MDDSTDSTRTSVMVNCLRAEKETFWIENQALPEEEIQLRWLRRTAELKRELSSVFEPTPPLQQSQFTLEDLSGQKSQDVGSFAQPMSRMVRGASTSSLSHGLDRASNLSHHSTPMSRKRSSNSQHGPTSLGSSASPIQTLPISRWQTDDVEPFNSLGRPLKIQRTGLAHHPTVVTYNNPKDFCSLPENAQASLSLAGPSKQYVQRHPHRLSSSPRQAFPFNSPLSHSPTTSSIGEGTNATTLTSVSMSRQSSHGGSSLCGGLDMMKINSQSSDSPPLFPVPELGSCITKADNEVAFDPLSDMNYATLAGHGDRFVHDNPSPSSISFVSNPFVPVPTVETSSSPIFAKPAELTPSNQIRVARRSLTEVNQSARPIAPKINQGTFFSGDSFSSGHDPIRIESDDGSSKVAVPIPKAPYVRPSHDKVKCNQCNEHPNGFRGDHELRRHTERKHGAFRKYYICKDISHNQQFLASCKACTSKKKYYAYYNATAHLRRAHFNPKRKGRKGKIEPEDRRGGKGGGKEPPMDVLKEWLETHEECVPENSQSFDDDVEDDEESEVPCESTRESNFHHSSIFAGPHGNSASFLSPHANISNSNSSRLPAGEVPPLLSASLTIPHPYGNQSLQLPSPTANPTDLFDLSVNTSDPSMIDSAEFLFPMDMNMSHFF